MKTLTALLILSAFALCGALRAADLNITVTDVRTARGQILIAVMRSEAQWRNESKPLAAQRVAAKEGTVAAHFVDLPAGVYAVQVMHDENDNNKLDTSLVGIPVEGFGFSNNPRTQRRARFDESRFAVGEKRTDIVIRLR